MSSVLHFPNLSHFVNWTRNIFPACCPRFLNKTAHFANIIATEAYANFRYILPASIAWMWRKHVTKEIRTIPLDVTVGAIKSVAYLNIHGKQPVDRSKTEVCPILLTHGDYGHPYTMLHLADIASKMGIPTFSLYLPGTHNNNLFDSYNSLLQKAIDKIEKLVSSPNGNFVGVFGVGHSKGAILLAQRQFVDLDPRIKATCAIAGRLNIPDEDACPDKRLASTVKEIHDGIMKNPKFPLMQIVPNQDWNASQESMTVRPHDHCYSVPGMHLSGLYHTSTRKHVTDFLAIYRR